MISKLSMIQTDRTDPYQNLALEKYLTFHTKEEECILFLWQNRHTVVIGKNQNCWKECKVNELERDGGFLVRRMSGGGAVFHDLGNLNFTFCVRKENYDVEKQLHVIVRALEKLGICAKKTGRNDITVSGRKISGNAFYEKGDFCYHHGTILVDVNKEEMSKYLNVSREKLATKGVASVKSRVANLSEFCPGITIEQVREALKEAFPEVYGVNAGMFEEERLEQNEITQYEEDFSSWEWKYGRKIPFTYEISGRFSWGGIELYIQVNEGKIAEADVCSDAMDQEYISRIPETLKGCIYQEQAMSDRLHELEQTCIGRRQMTDDICGLIRERI